MTNYQSNSAAYVAVKAQTARGSQASGASAKVLRTAGGQGGRLTMASTESNEVRRDGMRTRGRHGTQKTAGAYTSELSLGVMDDIFQAVFRGTWGSADLALTQSDFTSLTTGTHTIILTSGDPRSLGLFVGDVIRLTGLNATANNSKNLRITGLGATTITVAETLAVDAVADTTCTITRPGRVLINPPAGSLVERYFTIEEADLDIDGSEVFTDCKFGMLKFAMQPNGIIMVDSSWVGTGKFDAIQDSNSPWFSSPTEPTGAPMAVADATIRVHGSDLVDLTALDITMDIGLTAPDVFGDATSPYAPDVFSGQMGVSLNLTALRSDLQRILDYQNETVYSLHVLAVEDESEPKDFVSVYVGNFSLGGVDKSALSRQGGGRTESISVPVALVGKDTGGTGYNASMVNIQVSNAS